MSKLIICSDGINLPKRSRIQFHSTIKVEISVIQINNEGRIRVSNLVTNSAARSTFPRQIKKKETVEKNAYLTQLRISSCISYKRKATLTVVSCKERWVITWD